MQDISGLEAQVASTNTVQGSAAALINGFATRLADAGTDPVKLQALQDDLRSHTDSLAAAVSANTPAVPPVDPVDPIDPAIPAGRRK